MRLFGLISGALVGHPALGDDRLRRLPLRRCREPLARGSVAAAAVVRVKDAKLNIEHNATDEDTGFQGFVDSEGWRRLDVRGPGADVRGQRHACHAGVDRAVLRVRRARERRRASRRDAGEAAGGELTIAGPAQENGKSLGRTSGTAWLTHDIPAGPKLVSPAERATVPTRGIVARWQPVSKTITGEPVTIIAYQLIIEKDVEPHRHMIGKLGLSMYVPRSIISIAVPNGFLEPRTAYKWEVLAIERSGNQALSSGSFQTR